MEKKLAEKVTAEQRKEYQSVANQADAYSKEELHQVFQKYGIKSPETGNDLSAPYAFNLMFPAPIGPAGLIKGYLRPETAQGIFLNYKFCLEQNGNRMPFGVAQVGKAFRNEIAPRAGLTRQREFTQGEIEWFVKPTDKSHPKFASIADTQLQFFAADSQMEAGEPVWKTIGEAVKSGLVNNETLGYFITRTALFLHDCGVNPNLLRFRQHLSTEMAHYATDCWDAEICTCYGWLECVGHADRACFDLNAHAAATGEDLSVKEKLGTPITKEVFRLTKKGLNVVKKDLKKDSKAYLDWVESQTTCALKELQAVVQEKGSKEINCGCAVVKLTKDHVDFESAVEKTSVVSYTPGVVEP